MTKTVRLITRNVRTKHVGSISDLWCIPTLYIEDASKVREYLRSWYNIELKILVNEAGTSFGKITLING